MTYQEALYKGKIVFIYSLKSKNQKMHFYVKKYIGKRGVVLGEAKNGMLQIRFKSHVRNIPAGCVDVIG